MTIIDFKGKKLGWRLLKHVAGSGVEPVMLRSVHMAEVAVRIDDIADSLFELFWAGKTAIAFAFPYDGAVHGDLEQTAG